MAEKQDKQSQSQDEAQSQPTAGERKLAKQDRTQVTADAADVNTLTPEPGEDVGESQVQEVVDAQNEAGFRGVKMDPTPNENYAASNSAPGNDLPTPETDQDLRREAATNRQLDGPAGY
jgi:hypothetical protein